MGRASILGLLALSGAVTSAMAQAPTPLAARAGDLVKLLNNELAPGALFAPSFLAQVPADKVRVIAAQLSATLGRATGVATLGASGPVSARLTINYERGSADMNMALDPSAPNQVTGLLITSMNSQAQTPAQVIEALSALPGVTAFAFTRLGNGAPQVLAAHKPDQVLAIGSAFKLVILAELVREIAAGERKWDDLATLDGHALPGGAYTQMPPGTKVSLRELAQKMISISDNSATDILLFTLGREKVEAMLPVVGWHDVARNRPYLATLEMFKIKGIARFKDRWPTLDEKGRRALLREIDAAPIAQIDPNLYKDGRPILIEQAEWFASPLDLARVMDWLRKHSESGPAADVRAILSINPGVARGEGNTQWSYVGYKGGSEPGVITMTWLLQGKDDWYAISGGWNNPSAAIDDGRFLSIMMSALSGSGK